MFDNIFKLFIQSLAYSEKAECLVQITSRADQRIKLQKSISKFISSLTTPSVARTLVLALDECINNAYEHGNLELTNREKNKFLSEEKLETELHQRERKFGNRLIVINFTLKKNVLRISIADEGKGFDWKNQNTNPSQDALHGRGLSIVKAVFDKLTYNDSGNICLVEKELPPA